MKHTAIIVTVGLALAAALSAPSAMAQNLRSFVSPTGNDANPCNLSSPCRFLQAALAKTAAGGEITILGTAGYNNGATVTITQPVSIVNPGAFEAGIIMPSNDHAVRVSANGGGIVSLRGLTLEGNHTGIDGIYYLGGDRLEITDCVIRNFTHDGINLNVGNGLSGVKTALVSRTIASNNGANGIEIAPLSFFALRGALDQVTTANNGQAVIVIDGTNATNGGFVDFVVSNSLSESNGATGITAQALANEKVEIKNSTVSNNGTAGLAVSNARVGLSTTSLVLNGSGFSISNSGIIFSFGDNIIENNRDPNTGSLTAASRQ
jgi:hypothetical protein